MDGITLKDRIGQKKPRYRNIFRPLIDSISIKGARKGNFSTFGAYYQTFMYAFFIGYRMRKRVAMPPIKESTDFVTLIEWKPAPIKDFIVMLLMNESEEWGFKWIELENANEEMIETFVVELIRRMEEYANAGFEYLQDKFDHEKVEFQDPFVYVNILQQLPPVERD